MQKQLPFFTNGDSEKHQIAHSGFNQQTVNSSSYSRLFQNCIARWTRVSSPMWKNLRKLASKISLMHERKCHTKLQLFLFSRRMKPNLVFLVYKQRKILKRTNTATSVYSLCRTLEWSLPLINTSMVERQQKFLHQTSKIFKVKRAQKTSRLASSMLHVYCLVLLFPLSKLTFETTEANQND